MYFPVNFAVFPENISGRMPPTGASAEYISLKRGACIIG